MKLSTGLGVFLEFSINTIFAFFFFFIEYLDDEKSRLRFLEALDNEKSRHDR